MKKIKVIIASLLVLIAMILLISKLYDNNNKVVQEDTTTTKEEVSLRSLYAAKRKTKKKSKKKKVKKVKKKKSKKKTTTKIKTTTASKQTYIDYAKSYGNLNDTQTNCLIWLWDRESGWNPNAKNKSSGACGIPQALPCSKIKKQQGSNDWQAQIRWGLNYIMYRYKNPCQAWNHFKNKHWY